MSTASIITTSLPLPLVAKGKVRDVYESELGASDGEAYAQGALLFVATDRISAFDVILDNGIPDKGRLLHSLSTFWFDLLCPDVMSSHVLATDYASFPSSLRSKLDGVKDQVEGRSMLVRKAKVLPIEAIVRGYITGSAWNEYRKLGTVHGIPMPPNLIESQDLPAGALFTPSTKAEQGSHDENIHPDKVASIIGDKLAKQVSSKAVELYTKAADHARSRGIILADTKFEFGLIPSASGGDDEELILIDEVLTPDSSRFWAVEGYEPGRSQPSFDKQYVRDWLKANGLDGAADDGTRVRLPDDVVQRTREKYQEAYERITGAKWAA